MKRRIFCVVTACFFMAVTGCNQHAPTGPDPQTTVTLNPECGKFGISHLSGLGKRTQNAEVKAGADVSFDLGKIKGSTGFFFLLYNVGVTPITDVTLAIENQAFSVFPNRMDTLIPGSDVGMLPIVKVSAFHGTALDGIGARPVLPKGDNYFTLLIKGKSVTGSGADTLVELQAKMRLDALVMEYSMSMMHEALDIASPRLSINDIFNPIPALINKKFASFSGFCTDDTTVTVNNTGNTPLHVAIYQMAVDSKSSSEASGGKVVDTTLAEGTGGNFSVNTLIGSFEQRVAIVISGENCITDPSRIYQSEDGNCYYSITASTSSCQLATCNEVLSKFITAQRNLSCAKMYAHFQDTLLFYAQENPDDPWYSYRIYSLHTGSAVLLYSRSGTSPDSLSEVTGDAATYGALLDVVVPNVVNKEHFKGGDFGLGNNISCSFENWPTTNSSEK